MQKQQHLATIFLGKLTLLLLFSVIGSGCISTMNISANNLTGYTFASDGNLAYGGQNKFSFTDTSFVYYGTGPAKPISKGFWRYDPQSREVVLKTNNELKPEIIDPISTVWLDLSDKSIKVLSKDKLSFDNTIYRRQATNK